MLPILIIFSQPLSYRRTPEMRRPGELLGETETGQVDSYGWVVDTGDLVPQVSTAKPLHPVFSRRLTVMLKDLLSTIWEGPRSSKKDVDVKIMVNSNGNPEACVIWLPDTSYEPPERSAYCARMMGVRIARALNTDATPFQNLNAEGLPDDSPLTQWLSYPLSFNEPITKEVLNALSRAMLPLNLNRDLSSGENSTRLRL